MGVTQALLGCLFLCLSGLSLSDSVGKEFALVFMQNFFPNHGTPNLEVLLIAFSPGTQTVVWLPNGSFKKFLRLRPASPVIVAFPEETELLHTPRSNMTVYISSNKDIAVVATNDRPYTTSLGLIYPLNEWGTKYYIVTPDTGPIGTFGQVAIVNGPTQNLIQVHLKGSVQLENTSYSSGDMLNLTLGPWEAVQLQSNQSLSGSYLVSKKPVGLFAGHSCARKHTQCNHICLQLLPVTSWGIHFTIPPLWLLNTTNMIYMLAFTETVVNVQYAGNLTNKHLIPGKMDEFLVNSSTPVHISSSEGIMILLYCGGGFYKSLSYDVFLVNILPTEDFCTAYALILKPGFWNYALLVATRNGTVGFQLNHNNIPQLEWEDIPDTGLLGAQLYISQQKGFNVLSHPDQPFGLFTVGIAKMNSYGVTGVCLTKVQKQCEAAACMDDTLCQMVGRNSTWRVQHQTCIAWQDSHYRTFQGTYRYQPGNCTSVLISSNRSVSSSLPFTVERKPNPDFSVRIRAFDRTVTIQGFESDVLVDGVKQNLPVMLNDGKLTIRHHGFSVKADFSFGLNVLVGAHGFLHLRLPRNLSDSISGICNDGNSQVNFSGLETTKSPEIRLINASEEVCPFGIWRHYEDCQKKRTSNATISTCQLMAEPGIFQACHAVLDPGPFVESCIFDSCKYEIWNHCLSLEAYALACGLEGMDLKEWRNLTECGILCPSHSRYKSCLSMYKDKMTEPPASFCDIKPCYEACVCEDGFVQNSGSCVPEQYGCIWHGHFYPHGTEFLGKDCHSQCHCFGPNGTIECHQIQGCELGHVCEQLYSGQWYCKALPYMSCTAYGEHRYITFDNQHHSLQGSCTCKMAALCSKNQDLENFDVTMVNIEGTFKSSTYVKDLNITAYGITVTLSQDQNAQVKVDGILVHTPFVFDGGRLQILNSGLDGVLLQSGFGLIVSFNREGRLFVGVPASYAGALCGLCASLPNDPFPEVLSCSCQCQGNCSCGPEAYILYGSQKRCGMLKDLNGPFRGCQKRISSEDYFQNCLLDLCHYNGNEKVLCQALSSYAAACQEVGAVVHSWRTLDFCSPQCPSNSHYELCASSCPATCQESRLASCLLPCREGCICDAGYLLNGDRCVLPNNCGCLYNGQYLKPGDTIYNDNCSERCSCLNMSNLVCKNHTCQPGETCVITQGVRRCQYQKLATCWVSNNFQSYTFDEAMFNINGNCSYIMGKLCEPSNLNEFEVQLSGEPMNTSSYRLNSIVVQVYGHTMIAFRDPPNIQVDGLTKLFPTIIDDGKIMAFMHRSKIAVTTDFGLLVTLSPSRFSIRIPITYAGKVCGLCGNANKNSSDDFGSLNTAEFLSQWLVNSKETCGTDVLIKQATQDVKGLIDLVRYCGLLLNEQGPFVGCHALVSPKPYFEVCVIPVDVEKAKESYCQSLAIYTGACQEAGAKIDPWRNQTFCPFNCPKTSVYSLCANPCAAGCAVPKIPEFCLSICIEGCVCEDGLLEEYGLCVPEDKCGCSENGTYYKLGSVFMDEGCLMRCFCTATKQWLCEPFSCPLNHKCDVKAGVLDCYPTESSLENMECLIDPTTPECLLSAYTSCALFDDLGYVPFGNGVFSKLLPGPCTLVLAELCQTGGDVIPGFRIAVDYAAGRSGSIEKVKITLYGMAILMEKQEHMTVWVNGTPTSLPANLIPGKLWLKQDGVHIIMDADFGLLMYDGGNFLFVMIRNDYLGKMCGLCANTSQHLVLKPVPSAAPVSLVKECFQRNESLWNCSEPQLTNFSHCGILLNADGPFGACHNVLSPAAYFKACRARYCESGGEELSICHGLQDYAVSCQARGINLKPWRNDSFCSFPCPLGSQYDVCPVRCEKQCVGRKCLNPCIEGCRCPTDLLWDGLSCITSLNCSLMVNDDKTKPLITNGFLCGTNLFTRNRFQNCACAVKSQNVTTFSNITVSLGGDGVFEILQICDSLSKHWFRLVLRIQRNIPERVHLFFGQNVITISTTLDVWVNGNLMALPFTVSPNLNITRSVWDVTFSQAGVMAVTLSQTGELDITVPENFSTMLCGVCANYVVQSIDIANTLKSWRANDLWYS